MDQILNSGLPLDQNAQLELVQNLWNRDADETNLANYRSYLDYYSQEVKNLQFGFRWILHNPAAPTHRQLFPSITHRQLLTIIRVLSNKRALNPTQIIAKVKELPTLTDVEDDQVQRSIDMALRVWLTINVRGREFELLTPNTPCLQWDRNDMTLDRFVNSLVSGNIPPVPGDSGLENHFTAAEMFYSNGLNVEWTNCLSDHLAVDLGRREVRIYYMKQCLYDHVQGLGTVLGANGSMLPRLLLEETIWTLNLLFPPDDQQTINFLNGHKTPQSFYSEEPHNQRRQLDLSKYTFWRSRLIELQKIRKMEPQTVGQDFYRQKPAERLNLILTIAVGFILALVFGIISSVTALISMKASLDALEVSREALALQQQVPICPCS